jgi:hypothetical protein
LCLAQKFVPGSKVCAWLKILCLAQNFVWTVVNGLAQTFLRAQSLRLATV